MLAIEILINPKDFFVNKREVNFMEEEQEDEIFKDPTRILKAGNISLILDTYNELFSDFDPRNYAERTISDDFLVECKRALSDRPSEEFELRLLMPKNKRNLSDESKIKKRLKEHFTKHVGEKQAEVSKIVNMGVFMALLGFVLMITGAYLVFTNFAEGTFLASVLYISLEPAGWFFFWEGLAKAIFLHEEERKKKRELDFYKKMSRAQVFFLSY